ncbi:ATPase [Thozetella sp. PMI_491]|nr:ATPase [Thozetella sp. PMI_491]
MGVLGNISETSWKLRYKISNGFKSTDRTLDDFSEQSASLEEASSDSSQSLKGKKPAAKKVVASKAKDPAPGFTPCVKTLYEGPRSSHGNYNWVDYPPRQLSKGQIKAQSSVAIRAYKIKDLNKPKISGRSPLAYHMLEIQNPLLIAALNEAMKPQKISFDVNEIASFHAPFQSLFFSYDGIVEKSRSIDAEDPLQPYLQLLIRLLDEIFAETRAKLRHLRSRGLVSFSLAWAYFPVDTIAVSFANGDALCKVSSTAYSSTTEGEIMILHTEIVEFNGSTFVWEKADLMIPKFRGTMPIKEMKGYPLEFHDDPRGLMEKLTARGKRVLDFQGLLYCNYTGISVSGAKRHNVDGRILVDVAGYRKHQLAQGSREKSAKKSTKLRLTEEEQARNKAAMLGKEDLLKFISPIIQGYAMKNKLWMNFFVEDIRPITWNDEAYDHLVYDEQQKDLVLSFVESHGEKRPTIDDVIVGKGEGLIVLLSGPPGTGKTLMAEAVADRSHLPLFYLQAEDLGITADVLGANIKKVFEMATEWNAIVLLDEADVFMAERDPHNIARNELVSIFLRELEYFRGIIFLTTNLYATIDHAFRSRVSLHLQFPPLTVEARKTVWKKFLGRVSSPPLQLEDGTMTAGGPVELDDEDLGELAAWQLNGREIKNAVKMVTSWCSYKKYEMNLARLENGIKVTSPHATKSSNKENDHSLYDE